MASILIDGFKNDESAKEFISWFSGQGEQDISIWMECRRDEGKDTPDIYSDDAKTERDESGKYIGEQQDKDGNWLMFVKYYDNVD